MASRSKPRLNSSGPSYITKNSMNACFNLSWLPRRSMSLIMMLAEMKKPISLDSQLCMKMQRRGKRDKLSLQKLFLIIIVPLSLILRQLNKETRSWFRRMRLTWQGKPDNRASIGTTCIMQGTKVNKFNLTEQLNLLVTPNFSIL